MRKLAILVPVAAFALATGACTCPQCFGYESGPVPLQRLDAPAPTADADATAPGSAAARPMISSWSVPAAVLGLDDVAPAPVQATCDRSTTAFCWSCLFPGGGYFYTGETTRGAIVLGTAAGGLIGGAILQEEEYSCNYDGEEAYDCGTSTNRTPLWIGAGIAAGSWVYGILDARKSAERTSPDRLGFQPAPVVDVGGGETRVGLGLRVVW